MLSTIIYRGGFQKIPFSSAHAFFSQNNTENFAAVNKLQFLIESFAKAKSIKKHINQKINFTQTNIRCTDSGPSFITSNRPNIVLIILEGIPAVVFDSVYKKEINIPRLRKLRSQSYSYENVFASGFRTDQGISSLFSGIPAYPYINILKDVDEICNQSSLIQSLKHVGYQTSFYYGGDSQFSSLKKYLLSQNIDFLMDQSNFDSKARSMEWGVPDHTLFNASTEHIKTLKPPFFSTILTSSTHIPFDYPGNDYKSKTKKENFIGSLEYLDQYLGSLVDTLTNQIGNTLFIITSDHGSLYLGHDFNDHNRFKVPFLVFGDAVVHDLLRSTNTRYFNSHDFPLTISNLLKLPNSTYPLSSDMSTSDNHTSAYWVTEHTMGWLSNSEKMVSNHDCTKTYFSTNNRQLVNPELCQYFENTISHLHYIMQ